ncbi:hypothetical protein L208DRAFT_1376589 [Tricholoma matsutake]|nr:hypothetical protein L208DRAFT_1376589 [Tricholoma matsutake 945]
MAWTGLACLNFFINSVVWNNNFNNPAPVWCDISSRVSVASACAVPMAWDMPLNALEVFFTSDVVIIVYIPQHCRFMIIQDFGCTFASDNDPISVVLGMGPQSMVSLICTVYSILTIRALYKRYSELDELLPSNTIDKNLYFRVLMVGIISSAILFALTLQWFISNAANINHWPGWKILHTKLSCMELGPSTSNSRRPETFHINLEIARWKFVGNAFALFAFFGVQDYMKYLAIINISSPQPKFCDYKNGASSF